MSVTRTCVDCRAKFLDTSMFGNLQRCELCSSKDNTGYSTSPVRSDVEEAREWLRSERLPELLNSGGVVYDLRDIYIRIADHACQQERERCAQYLEQSEPTSDTVRMLANRIRTLK